MSTHVCIGSIAKEVQIHHIIAIHIIHLSPTYLAPDKKPEGLSRGSVRIDPEALFAKEAMKDFWAAWSVGFQDKTQGLYAGRETGKEGTIMIQGAYLQRDDLSHGPLGAY